MATEIEVECETCGRSFLTLAKYRSRGHGRFCSTSCSSSRRRPKEPNVECSFCGERFYKAPSKLANSKSGLYFCSRQHKDAAQRIGGITEIQPSHYGTSQPRNSYRRLAFDHYPARCKRCGYDAYPEVLQVHHMDNNHSNNELSNLEILCPTHHYEHHFLTRTGSWDS